MSCFGNLARGAAEVQMPNESNSGVVMHPKSKYERVERTAHVRLGAGAGSHRAGVYFENFTGTLFQLMPYRGTGCDELDRRSRCASPATAVSLGE